MTHFETTQPRDRATVRVIPLGGLGEIGMNLMVIEHGDAAVVVDCGMMFPDAATLGGDVIVPDLTYVFENAARIKAVFLTHAHEDHIGALPFLVERVKVPVFGMPLTLGFLRDKLEEFAIDDVEMRVIRPREVVEAGPFRVEAIRVTHSIVDALAFAIRTPAGTVVHTGDFKIDHTPVDNLSTDLGALARYGEEGVLLLLSDSTNALVPGHCPSERYVGDALATAIANARGRVIFTTFASHIHRIQQVIDLARRHGRRVTMIGRSLVDNCETAAELGYLNLPRDLGINGADGDRRVVIMTTGTQGEATSALSRMAVGEHNQVHIERGDVIIVSARTIPGNERAVAHMIDNLYRLGAEVVTWDIADVHVSGHACQEELKLMLNLTRPRFFIPMHGTLRHLIHHARLAESVGVPHGVVITNGQVVVIDPEAGSLRVLDERVPHGKVFIDAEAEEVPEVVVRDRQHLAEDGFVIVVVAVDSNGKLIRDPEIVTRGLVHVDANQEMIEEVRRMLAGIFTESAPD